MKIHKGDLVKVIYGPFKGKTGKVERVDIKGHRAVVAGVGVVKKHLKKASGGRVEVVKPLNIGKLGLVCPKCQTATRVGFRWDGVTKVRFCKKCQEKI